MRALKAAGAAVLLIVPIGAPPWLLVVLIGDPWPAGGVSLDAPLTDEAILGLLAALVWFLWAQFAASVIAELAASLTQDRISNRLPFTFGFQQQLARRLVSAVVIATVATPLISSGGSAAAQLVGSTTASPQSVAAASTHATSREPGRLGDGIGRQASPPEATSTAPGPELDRTQRVVTVMRLDTLWSIAERELGDGRRWTEVAELNRGRTMSDGSTFTSADLIRPGWQLSVPSDVGERLVHVRSGDSLSSIAAREMDGADKWPQLYEANQDVVGSDPDVIKVGQILQLPTAGDDIPPVSVPTSTTGSYGDEHRTPMRRPDVEADTEPTHPAVADRGDTTEDGSNSDISGLRALLATAVCLAAGSLTLLVGNRRRQLRYRRPGMAIRALPPEVRRTERVVHEAGSTAEDDARFIDLALRDLGARARAAGDSLPDLGMAVLDAERLTLLLRAPASSPPPDGWSALTSNEVWSLSRSTELLTDLRDQPSPYPALVSIAVDDSGCTWLLDLEPVGDVTITGDPERSRDLVRFLVAELAVNAWAEGVEVLLTDDGLTELVDLEPRRIRMCQPGKASRRAAARASELAGTSSALLERRRDDVATDSTWPLVVVAGSGLGPDLTPRPRSGVVVLRPTGPQEGVTSTSVTARVASDGALKLAAFECDLRALVLPAGLGADMAQLMTETRSVVDEPMPASVGESEVAAFIKADGALNEEFTGPRSSEVDSSSLLPEPDSMYLDRTATTRDDMARLAPSVPADVQQKVTALDPALDADLRDWLDDDCERPKVRVLGPVDVVARGGEREPIRNIGGTVEFIVYLACREHGVTKDRAAEDLGWSGATVQNRARDARRVLGQRADGTEWLPDAARSEGAKRRGVATYELDGAILVDGDLFRRLRTRASARGDAGVADLVNALSLVTGEPFDQLRRGGYGWLLEGDRLDHHLSASVSDVAHLVVTRAITEADLDLAHEASRIALLSDPYSEVAALDIAAVAAAAGSPPNDDLRRHVDESDDEFSQRAEDVMARRSWLAG